MTAGGIALPDAVLADRNDGRVLGVGSECREDLAVGDEVLFHRGVGALLGEEGDLLMDERDVLAKIER